ncbi:Peroxidase 52, partial [Stylosanthes scabra]|nr:Peroxidase 52 [Stylosanthes scabra]
MIPSNGNNNNNEDGNNNNNGRLTWNFYKKTCPKVLPVIRYVVEKAIKKEPRVGASLLRLHFHDCFVNGCDGSVLLDDSHNINGEKNSPPNKNSLRGFEVVDEIKSELDKACNASIVSCADILAVAARDSVSF